MADEDLKHIAPAGRSRIARAIETRLASAPDRYGEPLAGSLRGYRKLRVGDDRVVFQVIGDIVWIVAIIHRRDAYDRAARRLG